MIAGLGKKIAIGALWSVLTRLTIKSLGFVSTIILARLLFPEDFGILAATMAMVAFFEIFTSFSFDINIIQKDHVSDDTLNSAWTCKLLSSALLAIVLFFASPWISDFFNDTALIAVMQIVAFLPLVNSFENIGFVLFRKNLDLRKEFNLEVITKIFSFCVTIASAFWLKNYWALVIGMYSNAFARVLLSYIMHSYRPSLSLVQAAELFQFSKWLLLNNLLIFFNHKVTDLIIGHKTNTTQLGYYSVSYEISNLPTTELVFPLSRAIFPGYSQVKHDRKALKSIFTQITGVTMLVAAPISFGLAAVSYEAVMIFLGEKWITIAPLIAILSFYGLVRCAVQNIGNVFVAIGKPKISAYLSLTRLIIIVPIMLYQVEANGIEGAAMTILITSLITAPTSFLICHHYLKFSIKDVVKIFTFPLATSAAMFGLLHWANLQFDAYWLQLLVKAGIGTTFYASMFGLYITFIDKDNFVAKNISNLIKKRLTN